jgi:hypothetical protein
VATAYLLFVIVGIVVTIVGIAGLGLGSSEKAEIESERRLSHHRRRTLLRMLQTRSTAAR